MSKSIHMTAAALLSVLLSAAVGVTGHAPAKPKLIIVGTVVKVGPSPGRDSGGVDVYQLVRYRVKRVCKGQYKGEEIVVDHLILRADELGGLKAGDTVCVAITPEKQTPARYDDDEVRKATDEVSIYYIGTVSQGTESSSCRCQ